MEILINILAVIGAITMMAVVVAPVVAKVNSIKVKAQGKKKRAADVALAKKQIAHNREMDRLAEMRSQEGTQSECHFEALETQLSMFDFDYLNNEVTVDNTEPCSEQVSISDLIEAGNRFIDQFKKDTKDAQVRLMKATTKDIANIELVGDRFDFRSYMRTYTTA